MMGQVRAFIAIKIPEYIVEKIKSVQNELKKTTTQVSWVNPGNIHITLKFLGNIDESKIDEVVSQIKNAVVGLPQFNIRIQGIGAFPNFKRPKVFWIGTEQNEQLIKLANSIDMNMLTLGFKKESRPFKAHLTFGRVKGTQEMTECLDILHQNINFKGGCFLAEEIFLIKSDLKPTGAVYTPLEKIKLEQ